MRGASFQRPGQPEPVSIAAAEWALRQEERALTDAEGREFAEWLSADDAHLAAFDDALWALDAPLRQAGEHEMLALRHAALSAGEAPRRWQWTAGLGLLAASMVAAVVSIGLKPSNPSVDQRAAIVRRVAEAPPAIYETGVGERSAITLPDGSVATLDTDSQIRLAYTARERGVHLVKGQALFEVAHGKANPFQVYARGQRITAVGTTFNVRLAGTQVRVAMVEGVVRVRSLAPARVRGQPMEEMTVTAGEALIADPTMPLRVRSVDVDQVVSWKGGMLVFNDTRLSDAVAEINRYTTRPIAIADEAVGDYRISGVFKSNDPRHFSRAVSEILPVEVSQSSEGVPTLRARSR